MTRKEVEDHVIAALKQIQSACSPGEQQTIGPETRAVEDLVGFDSLNGEEAAVLLESALGCDLPGHIFVTNHPKRALTVREVVDSICHKLTLD